MRSCSAAQSSRGWRSAQTGRGSNRAALCRPLFPGHAARRIQKDEYLWNPSTSGYQLSTTLKFLYDGWDLVAELDGSGNALRSYGWLGKAGGLLWVKDHVSGEFHVPSFDGNRNVTRLIQFSGRSVSAEYEYGPYGTLLRATGPMALANPMPHVFTPCPPNRGKAKLIPATG